MILRKWQVHVLQSAIRQRLLDPTDARFGKAVGKETLLGFDACGIVNAKNSFGGYTGKQLYFASVMLEPFELLSFHMTNKSEEIADLKSLCDDAGIRVPRNLQDW